MIITAAVGGNILIIKHPYPDNIYPTARGDGRSIMGIVAVLFLVLKILIKAVGDELCHPPFIRRTSRYIAFLVS